MGRLGDGATSRRPFSSAGLARATASATAAVKRGTDAWPKKSARSTHVPRTSSRKSEGVEEARSRLAGAGYSGSGSNPVPASSSCSGSASSRSRAAADGASCFRTFAGFRNLRSFLLGTHHIHYIVESQRDLSWRTALRGHVAINTCGRGRLR